MFVLQSFVTAALGLAAITEAVPLDPRASIAHNAVASFPQLVPSGSTGQTYLAYQPLLAVSNGCVPFPGVDSAGNTK